MGLRRILQKKPRLIIRKSSPHLSDLDGPPVKNGWLGLAVIGSVLIMAVLVALSLRLTRNASLEGKSVSQAASAQRDSFTSTESAPLLSACENRSGAVPPEVTFYSKLVAPEDQSRTQDDSARSTITETDTSTPRGEAKGPEHLKSAGKAEARNRKQLPALQRSLPGSGDQNLVPPSAQRGTKSFTVQVGAFSHPGVAQQWAVRWKARGYDVSLKPVARPTGVIYRLYLGKFSSEIQADELVRHLKSKEGISALRLVVRN